MQGFLPNFPVLFPVKQGNARSIHKKQRPVCGPWSPIASAISRAEQPWANHLPHQAEVLSDKNAALVIHHGKALPRVSVRDWATPRR
jgi:hypothetical protein